jgi:meso-butanediol dehydrogenase/(S,S)-butanediol dehydrogenase/diacetyl reductase
MAELSGQVALVTGAGQGAGRGIALALAEAGAWVAVVGRTQTKLDEVASAIERDGGRALAFSCDVASETEIRACVARVQRALGPVRILANVAHHDVRRGALLEMQEADIELNFATGPIAALRFMRACHDQLAGGGCIINVGSGAQFRPQGYGIYAAAKEAILAITRAAAVEWGAQGIRANVLVPHTVSPAMERDLSDPARRAASLARIPLGRFGQPEDIGRVAAFLAGTAAAFVTGQMLVVDGGMTYHR